MTANAPKRRIGIIIQRYGAEINGGAELLARLIAQALKADYRVDVLTSRALNYRDWDNHYPAGESWLDDCRVLRFEHPQRDRSRRKHLPLRHKLRFKLRNLLTRLGFALVSQPTGHDAHDGLPYLRAQGPIMDGLFTYLREQGHEYAALIFVTALYHPAALGLLAAPQRAILVPNLHDEKAMYLPHFHRLFRTARWIMYNTAEEQALAHRLYGDDIAAGEVCGVGIGSPSAPARPAAGNDERSRETARQLSMNTAYLLYIGRVDASKGCAELFADFARLRRHSREPLKLVVCGQLFMRAPRHPDIILAGFVSQQERDALTANALALIVPSRYESLSLVLLESLAAGCPVIVNRRCKVLHQHVQASGVGLAYSGSHEFADAVARVQAWDAATRNAQAERGRVYVHTHYDWASVVAKYRRVIDAMSKDAIAQTPAEARAGAQELPNRA